MDDKIRIGTRDSRLARWQTDFVFSLLKAVEPGISITIVPIKTTADLMNTVPLEQIGGTGLFTKEIEHALLENQIDIAIHSLKDLATDLPDGLTIGAVPVREDNRDALITKKAGSLENLPEGATILTGSPRRKAQLLHLRNDFCIENIRGNVETRIKKLHKSDADALILAAAGLKRLGLSEHITAYIPVDILVPAVGQGALGVQVRSDDKKILKLCSRINNRTLFSIAAAERSFLRKLQGGCRVPVGCAGKSADKTLELTGVVASPDGKKLVKERIEGDLAEPETLGERLADKIADAGGQKILESFRKSSTDMNL